MPLLNGVKWLSELYLTDLWNLRFGTKVLHCGSEKMWCSCSIYAFYSFIWKTIPFNSTDIFTATFLFFFYYLWKMCSSPHLSALSFSPLSPSTLPFTPFHHCSLSPCVSASISSISLFPCIHLPPCLHPSLRFVKVLPIGQLFVRQLARPVGSDHRRWHAESVGSGCPAWGQEWQPTLRPGRASAAGDLDDDPLPGSDLTVMLWYWKQVLLW